jgi:hypothetical protein
MMARRRNQRGGALVTWKILITDKNGNEHTHEQVDDEDNGTTIGHEMRIWAVQHELFDNLSGVSFSVNFEDYIVRIYQSAYVNYDWEHNNANINNQYNSGHPYLSEEAAQEASLQASTAFSPAQAPINPRIYNDPSPPPMNAEASEVNSNNPPMPLNTDPISFQGGRRRSHQRRRRSKTRLMKKRKGRTTKRRRN